MLQLVNFPPPFITKKYTRQIINAFIFYADNCLFLILGGLTTKESSTTTIAITIIIMIRWLDIIIMDIMRIENSSGFDDAYVSDGQTGCIFCNLMPMTGC